MPLYSYRQPGKRCEDTGPHFSAIGGIGGKIQPCCRGVWGFYYIKGVKFCLRVDTQDSNEPFYMADGMYASNPDQSKKTLVEWTKQWSKDITPDVACREHGPHFFEGQGENGIISVLKPCCVRFWTATENTWERRLSYEEEIENSSIVIFHH